MVERLFDMDPSLQQFTGPELKITRLNDGFGYGHGSISAEEIHQQVGDEAYNQATEVITDPERILVPVDRDSDGNVIDDDGCGDGRGVKRVLKGLVEKAKSLNRAKVFGGGVTMTAAAMIGLGKATAKSVNGLFSSAISVLEFKGLNFGAHTADHVKPGREELDSGCGAIDKAPEIIQAAVDYESQIRGSIESLGIPTDGLDEVFGNYRSYAAEIAEQPYAGKQVTAEITADDKVVKELQGEHIEAFTVLNTVRGYTVNQRAVREATGGKIDVFAVDVWRMEDYANELYETEDERRKAFLSELVYTLATAAVLTKGDQAVYLVEAEPALVAA